MKLKLGIRKGINIALLGIPTLLTACGNPPPNPNPGCKSPASSNNTCNSDKDCCANSYCNAAGQCVIGAKGDACDADPSKNVPNQHPQCDAGLGCAFDTRGGTSCGVCAADAQECFTNGLNCCASAGGDDCVFGLPGQSIGKGICTNLPSRCQDVPLGQCRFLLPGGGQKERTCCPSAPGENESPCPASGFCDDSGDGSSGGSSGGGHVSSGGSSSVGGGAATGGSPNGDGGASAGGGAAGAAGASGGGGTSGAGGASGGGGESANGGEPGAGGTPGEGGSTNGGNASAGGGGSPGTGNGAGVGDPHLLTFDGLKYDFQAVGEFTLTLDPTDKFEVQIRTAPWAGRLDISMIVGVAANVAGDRVSFFPDGSSFVNDVGATLAEGTHALANGGELRASSGRLVIAWPNGDLVTAHARGFYLDVELSVAASRTKRLLGLLGNFDRDAEQELASRDGALLGPKPTFADFYGGFAESWRIRQEDSLFTYRPGTSTETFTDRTFPHTTATSANVPSDKAALARATCMAAGVTDAVWLDACILDVSLTGDARFAAGLTLPGAATSELDVQPRSCPLPGSKLAIGFAPTDPERVVNLQWTDSAGVVSANLAAAGGGQTCQDPSEFFGQSYGAPESTSPGIVVAGHQASVTTCSEATTITSALKDCSGASQVPVTTTYLLYNDARANQVRIARSFGFDSTTPLFNSVGLRPYVPRLPLGSFSTVIYPNAANSAVTKVSAASCGGDCFISAGDSWNGHWFADVSSSAAGYAMIVLRDPSMTAPVQMTINNDASSGSNLASFVLVQPSGGFKQPLTEVEYLCFADLTSWPQAQRDAAQLPAGCGP